jgi:hypothetical protein
MPGVSIFGFDGGKDILEARGVWGSGEEGEQNARL